MKSDFKLPRGWKLVVTDHPPRGTVTRFAFCFTDVNARTFYLWRDTPASWRARCIRSAIERANRAQGGKSKARKAKTITLDEIESKLHDLNIAGQQWRIEFHPGPIVVGKHRHVTYAHFDRRVLEIDGHLPMTARIAAAAWAVAELCGALSAQPKSDRQRAAAATGGQICPPDPTRDSHERLPTAEMQRLAPDLAEAQQRLEAA